MTYQELKRIFVAHEATDPSYHLTGIIQFSNIGDTLFHKRERSYFISSNNKAFRPDMNGYSIFGSCLDGTDNNVRLDAYMADEHGSANGWKVETCCIVVYILNFVKEQSFSLPEFFYDADTAHRAMVQQLCKITDADPEELEQCFNADELACEDDDFGLTARSAWTTKFGENYEWRIFEANISNVTDIVCDPELALHELNL